MYSVRCGFMRMYAPDGPAGSPRSAQPAAAGAFKTARFLPGGIPVGFGVPGGRAPKGQARETGSHKR
jgi:hypothetical protein